MRFSGYDQPKLAGRGSSYELARQFGCISDILRDEAIDDFTPKVDDFSTRWKEGYNMSPTPDPRQELASTYMVSDRSNAEEIARLQVQERLLTSSMGGVLAEQSNPERFERILDVGCGPGGWLIETAQTYPQLARLVGIDINSQILAIARERVSTLHLEKRVEFHTMDALRMLEFPNASFDLVNQRAGISWLRRWDWPKLIQEYLRILRPEGVVRITEVNGALESTSPALLRLWNLAAEAFYQSGIAFSPSGNQLGEELVTVLEQRGLKQVHMHISHLEYHLSTQEGQLFLEDMRRLFRTIRPFLERWIRLPQEYEEIYQQMLKEMANDDFVATANLFTVWGTRSL